MKSIEEVLTECRTGRWDSNILGLFGIIYDDGSIELLTYQGRLKLPAPAAEIIETIRARHAAQEKQIS